jgi:hypothetical protein
MTTTQTTPQFRKRQAGHLNTGDTVYLPGDLIGTIQSMKLYGLDNMSFTTEFGTTFCRFSDKFDVQPCAVYTRPSL